MSEQAATVTVKILDKEYQVSCPPDEVDALTLSARHLDEKMRDIRESGKVFGLDRIAVMAALNIANEFISNRESYGSSEGLADQKVSDLAERIIQALADHEQPN
ncbi:MAG: cell division protein ZapA [Gammaproteobacteria bacterium]|nr:cell division protein ZapA [Gammaproteobacteria bacterium]